MTGTFGAVGRAETCRNDPACQRCEICGVQKFLTVGVGGLHRLLNVAGAMAQCLEAGFPGLVGIILVTSRCPIPELKDLLRHCLPAS